MPTTCHRCGAALEEGTAFCPSCGAAQIRVAAGEPNAAFPPGTPGNIQPPATPVALSTPIVWSVGMKAAVLMGLLAAVPSSIPVVSIGCCLWVIGAAAFTVRLYQNWKPGPVSTGMGARLGAIAGLFAFFFWFLFKAAAQAVRGSTAFKAQLMQQMHEAATKNPDPNAQRAIEQLSTPEGITIVLAVVVVMMLVSFVIFGIIGGAVGASLWGKRQAA